MIYIESIFMFNWSIKMIRYFTELFLYSVTLRFYFKFSLKNCSSLSKGIMSILSYRSVWTAPGIIIISLFSPFSFLKAPSLK